MSMGPDKCQLSQLAFCDTFQSIVGGGRGGDLDPAKWSFAREQQNHNPAQGMVNTYSSVNAEFCTTHQVRRADQDSFICGAQFGESNHWMEALNDAGSYATNSARILQPFDFAGRTGNMVFDVDNKSLGGDHTHWTNVWLTDQPVQIPHLSAPSTDMPPRNGIGLDFSSGEKDCGTGHNGLRGLHVYTNYNDSFTWADGNLHCFTASDDMANHLQIKISRTRIEVWSSDAGGANFRLISAFNVNLNFTRGYWSFQHVAYNAGKEGNPSQVTYHWHAIGFDGPVLPADRDYQVPDALQQRSDGSINLGYVTPKSYTFPNVNLANIGQAYVTYNVFYQAAPHIMTATVNGHAETLTEPYTGNNGYNWSYLTQPIPLTDLTNGTNTLQLTGGTPCTGNACPAVANIDLELVPKSIPVPPLSVKAVSSSTTTSTGSLLVTFVARANNGSAITRFNVGCTSKNGGGTKLGVRVGPIPGPVVITGVTTAKLYTCAVSATNPMGTSAPSAPSHAVTVGAPAQPVKPIATKVSSGVLSVSFARPVNNGASITGYTVVCSSGNGGVKVTVGGAASPLTVRGLTPGKSYTCMVAASNSRGLGVASAPSAAVSS
jgi:hypothetical protein